VHNPNSVEVAALLILFIFACAKLASRARPETHKRGVLIANEILSLLGTVEILPMESALTVFVWNKNRITPVRITDLSITEEAFDPQLNPIRAKVSLGMRVLNVNDVGFLTPAGALYMIYQITKEGMAG